MKKRRSQATLWRKARSVEPISLNSYRFCGYSSQLVDFHHYHSNNNTTLYPIALQIILKIFVDEVQTWPLREFMGMDLCYSFIFGLDCCQQLLDRNIHGFLVFFGSTFWVLPRVHDFDLWLLGVAHCIVQHSQRSQLKLLWTNSTFCSSNRICLICASSSIHGLGIILVHFNSVHVPLLIVYCFNY